MVVGEVVGMVEVAMVEIAAVVAMVETVAVVVDMEVVVMEVSKLCFRDYDQNLGCLKKIFASRWWRWVWRWWLLKNLSTCLSWPVIQF